MSRASLFDSLVSLEGLEPRLSPSSLSPGAAVAVTAVHQVRPADDDPMPRPGALSRSLSGRSPDLSSGASADGTIGPGTSS